VALREVLAPIHSAPVDTKSAIQFCAEGYEWTS
jgi:hypothetical protein